MTSTSTETIILGIDEVGRGPWAGPLVVGAAILSPELNSAIITQNSNTRDPDFDFLITYLTDSKKLTSKRRERLVPLIQRYASTTTGWVSARELDQYGLSASLKLATRRAVKQLLATKTPFTEIVIDGTINFLQNTPLADRVTTLPKADALIPAVSAASIIAKVARDHYMIEIAQKYPGYGFEKHVGYGTAAHKTALLELGACPEHRTSFRPIREIMAQFSPKMAKNALNAVPDDPNFTQNPPKSPESTLEAVFPPDLAKAPSHPTSGQKAEISALRHLQAQNHQIIAHNYRTKSYEIDLISIRDRQIFFTEVKYSQSLGHEGTPLVRITPGKHQQMTFAAQSFLSTHPEYRDLQPLLAVASVTNTDYIVQDWFVLTD